MSNSNLNKARELLIQKYIDALKQIFGKGCEIKSDNAPLDVDTLTADGYETDDDGAILLPDDFLVGINQ